MNIWYPEQQLFDKRELFAYIRSCGLQIDESLLEEFQKQELMTPPSRRGKGRAKSNPGIWTRQQRDLLHTLCIMRERHNIRQVAQRCNFPVWVWLYWGEEYGITLSHVKKVMKTWAERQPVLSLKKSQQEAKKLVKWIANQNASGKRQAINEIADMLYTRNYTTQDIADSLYHAFDRTKPANGPRDIPVSPENISGYIGLRTEATNALMSNQEIPDAHWKWARHFHLIQLSNYLQDQRRYAHETAGSPVEQLFSADTIESLWSSACSDLAAVVGIGLLYPSSPGLTERDRLDVWKSRVKDATVTSRQVVSPLLLPNGTHSMSLHIVETVSLLEAVGDKNRNEKRRR